MKALNYINRSIEYLFYSLFLLVPLVFAGNTSELFEFNKMWLTFGVTALILSLWLSKMVLLRKVVFKRTIFDIPILLFLISQIVSTFISLDPHISLWGYYSRWNGGLLSTITYIILFYAFVSNFFNHTPEKDYENKSWVDKNPTSETIVKRSLFVSLASGLIVIIWALPSHFGYDPTCLVFRGTFDVSCWTADFMPRVRIFGPLGQPNWLAGYLGILLPITAGFIIQSLRNSKKILNPYLIGYSVLFFLFYISLLYTRARSGIIAFVLSMSFMAVLYLWLNRKNLSFLKNIFVPIFLAALVIPVYIIQINMPYVDKFSLTFTKEVLSKPDPVAPRNDNSADYSASKPTAEEPPPAISALTSGGTQSNQIRDIVWRGGLDAWQANPIFGTGVETFAFAYYKYRPIEHNNVSEWNFLYNKAHNEYINYLATTGLFGFLSYMAFILLFIFLALINLFNKKIKDTKYFGAIKAPFTLDKSDPLILSLLTAFIAILIINFFGFSVVILNIYLFLIPAFALLILQLIKQDEFPPKIKYTDYTQWAAISGLLFLAFAIIFILIRFWIADTNYALGSNYNKAGDYQTAYPLLQKAVDMRKEPVFQDELAVNKAILALGLAQQQQQQQTTDSAEIIQKLATEALAENEKLVREHPNNILYLKSRVRILYTLANLDPSFMPAALQAIQAAAALAPTDASILYNLGVLYGQNGDSASAIKVLEQTVAYKPNYREAHFALALFYHDLGVDATTGQIKDPALRQKAIDQLNFLLTNLDPNYQQAKDSLSAWEKEK